MNHFLTKEEVEAYCADWRASAAVPSEIRAFSLTAHGRLVAQCTSWESRAAATRLLCGSSVMLPIGWTIGWTISHKFTAPAGSGNQTK